MCQGQSQMLHGGAVRWSVHAAGRGAGEISKELVGGLEWDFSCMESSAVLHACLAVSVTLGLADTQESLTRDFQRMLHTNGGRLPHVPSWMGRGTVQCKMKRDGWDSLPSPNDLSFFITIFLTLPRPSTCSGAAAASATQEE